VPKFSRILYDSTNNSFFEHQNKVILVIKLLNPRTWFTLKNSLVIFLASDTYAASLTSAASETSMASMTSKAPFPQKLPDFDDFIPTGTKMTNTGPFLRIGSSKIQIFTGTW
jgi:hypothetical protein